MKKHLLKSLLALALVLISGSAWGKTYSLTPDGASTGSSATSYITELTDFTYNSVSWKMNHWNPSTLQVKTNQSSAASEFRFYNTTAFPGSITKVVIKFQALTVTDASKFMFKGGTEAVTETSGGTAGTWNSEEKTLTWIPSSDSFAFFAFYQNGQAASGTNKLAGENAIEVTYTTGKCFTPAFSPEGGVFLSEQTVTLSCSTTGANIYYTTNGDTPTAESTQYSSPISVAETKTIKAIAIKDGLDNSNIAEASYTIYALSGQGTAVDPYTVQDAFAAIDANARISKVYVKGIVSQVDSYDIESKSITYRISADGATSNELNVYKGKGKFGADFDGLSDININDEVLIYGTLRKDNDTYEFSSNSQLVTPIVDNSPKSNYFTRVTDISTLSEGDNIILVHPDDSKAMGAQSGNNCPAVGVVINGDVIESIGADVQKIILQSSTDNNWYLYAGGKYLYAASSSSNYLKLEETPDDNAKATISMSGEETIIRFQGTNTHNYIKYNTTYKLFSCYVSGQKNVTIYKEVPKVDVPITSAGWATAYLPFQAAMPTGVTAYIINGTTGENALTLTEVTGDIPANTGVLLKGAEGNNTFTSSSGTAADVSDNMLVGTADAGGKTFNETGMKYYILANDPDKYGLGFYFQTAGGASVTCGQYKAVLAVPAGSSSAIGFRLDGATMIDAVQAAAKDAVIYDLTGRRVENPARGIYIVNGKKVLMK